MNDEFKLDAKNFDLSDIDDLRQEVKALIPSLVSYALHGYKPKLTVEIAFHVSEDTSSEVVATCSVKPSYPKKESSVRISTGSLTMGRQIPLPLDSGDDSGE